MLNNQPISKVVRAFNGTLSVHSIFHTIQGEGPFCGVPAVFIRLAGCNLQCPWCDTEYTEGARDLAVEDIVAAAEEAATGATRLVVITGGEPFRQPIGPLIEELVAASFYAQVETNGTLPIPAEVAFMVNRDTSRREGLYIVCSPKTGKVDKSIQQLACCYKYVVDTEDGVGEDDGLPLKALGHTANPRLARPPVGYRYPIYIQPADHKDEARNRSNMDLAVASAMQHGYTVQLQIHKTLNME